MNVDPRWATEQLETHTARRRALGYEKHVEAPRTPWDRDDEAPPPVFALSDDPQAPTATTPLARVVSGEYSASPSRWASRFRHSDAPPPPLPPITDRDVAAVMRTLGIDPADPRAMLQLESQVEDGALGPDPDDPTGRRPLDVYGYIRGMQRASQKRAGRRSVLIPQDVLDNPTPNPTQGQSRPYPNDRSGGGPMYPTSSSDPRTVQGRRAYPTNAGSVLGPRPEAWDTEQDLSAPPPASTGQPVYDDSFPAFAAEGYPSGSSSTFRTAQASPLTQSQKRRLRRKKQRQQGTGSSSPQTRSFPMPDQEVRVSVPADLWHPAEPAPVVPTNGEADWPHPDTDTCGESIPVWFTAARPTILTCPLRPYPHPNQPHIVQIDLNRTNGVEVFVGWWSPDPNQEAPV